MVSQPRDVHLAEDVRLRLQGDQLIAETAVLQAVVEVELACLEALSELSVQPELVAVGVHAGGVSVGVAPRPSERTLHLPQYRPDH